MRPHWGLTISGLLAAILMAGCNSLFSRSTAMPDIREQVEMAVFSNERHGFSVSYPASLDIQEYSHDNAVLGVLVEDQIAGVAEIRVLIVEGETGNSMIDAVGEVLLNLCAADGPSESISCTELEMLQPVTSQSNIAGQEVYLKGVHVDLLTEVEQEIRKGPFFVFPLATVATASKVVVLHPPMNKNVETSDAELITNIAESLHITAPGISDTAIVEQYVADHISELSPKKEVLGGTFYVTKIVIGEGTGTVEYEDGHIAYTADFKYSVREGGYVEISSFTLRT